MRLSDEELTKIADEWVKETATGSLINLIATAAYNRALQDAEIQVFKQTCGDDEWDVPLQKAGRAIRAMLNEGEEDE